MSGRAQRTQMYVRVRVAHPTPVHMDTCPYLRDRSTDLHVPAHEAAHTIQEKAEQSRRDKAPSDAICECIVLPACALSVSGN